MILGTLPYIADGFPRVWPKTIDSVGRLSFEHVMPGHGPAQHDRQPMTNERNYIEELAERIGAGKKAGKTTPELQTEITVESLKSIQNFAGEDIDKAVVEPEAQAALVEFDDFARHYEVAFP